ncbi:uncharacterized protein LOC129988927 [Argiope bruennichi]|uniref:uncharacterized protein LOC129988927 n=1 Tax=Argiope bruennichi TaxID=94029 RepID=UPI0024948442|nr:uncharacterized protein LOC129988927 [Argiope bruennichi]XP_055953189.1 uncharacterized protein LOC129988927 [Argiope bruennichi]
MEPNDSDVYVAKLLEQLEELKKKKARKLKKLKKLVHVQGKETASTSIENVSAPVSPLQSIQNHSVSTHSEEKENITDLNNSSSSFLNSCTHNVIHSAVKETCRSFIKTNNSSSSLNFESNSSNTCLDKSLLSSAVNILELPSKGAQNDHSENGCDSFSKHSIDKEKLGQNIKNTSVNNNILLVPMKKIQNNPSETGSDLFSENSTDNEILNQNMKDISGSFCLNNPLNDLEEIQRKMKKRPTSESGDSTENSAENKKKFKLSGDISDVTDICTKEVSEIKDVLNHNDCVFSDKTEQPLNGINGNSVTSSKTSDDCNEDSLSHNMTCFMSCSLFIGEEDDNINTNIRHSVKRRDFAELAPNLVSNVSNMVSLRNCINSMVSSSLTSEQNDIKKSESLKSRNELDLLNKHPSNILKEVKHNAESSHISDIALYSIKDLETIDSSVNAVQTSYSQELDNFCEVPDNLSNSTRISVEEVILPSHNSANRNSSDLSMSDKHTSFDSQKPTNIWPENEMQWENTENGNKVPEVKIECAISATKSVEDVTMKELVLPPQNTVVKNSSIPSKHDSQPSFDSPNPAEVWPDNEFHWDNADDGIEVIGNQTPSLLDSSVSHSHQTELNYKYVNENEIVSRESVNQPVALLQTIDISDNGLVDDALTADIDFNSSMSLEVSDTADSLLNESSKEKIAASVSSHNGHLMEEQNNHPDTNVENNTEVCVLDTEIFTIPETEFFESSHSNEVDTIIENKICLKQKHEPNSNHPISVSSKDEVLTGAATDSLQIFGQVTSNYAEKYNEVNFLNEQFSEALSGTLDQLHTIQETVLLEADDTQDLGNQKIFPELLTEKFSMERYPPSAKEIIGYSPSNVTLTHMFHSDIDEVVQNIKFVNFSHSSYIFIQHITWIQIWRQEENKDWSKVFFHEVGDNLQLKDVCCSTDNDYLVLVMLLKSNEMYCLQFLLFEKERKVIKLMEYTHWLKNKCSDNAVLLCGLEGLKFAVAQKNNERFEVFVHVFNCLEENPRLLTAVLGSTAGNLKSLCSIEKLPNALMGTSESTLYVWHVLEARLVTSVNLQSSDTFFIENCIWATIENGLVFFMAVCKADSSQSCELLAANLATGFCQKVMVYNLRPARDTAIFSDKIIKAIYKEPFLAVTSTEGAFLWCATKEYCCAALDEDAHATAVALHRDGDIVSMVIGNKAGCVHSYNINSS